MNALQEQIKLMKKQGINAIPMAARGESLEYNNIADATDNKKPDTLADLIIAHEGDDEMYAQLSSSSDNVRELLDQTESEDANEAAKAVKALTLLLDIDESKIDEMKAYFQKADYLDSLKCGGKVKKRASKKSCGGKANKAENGLAVFPVKKAECGCKAGFHQVGGRLVLTDCQGNIVK